MDGALTRAVVKGFDGSVDGSCFAREAAVGAVRCDGRLTGLVTSLGFGFDDGDVVLTLAPEALSEPADLAAHAAVGAVRELRLVLFERVTLGDCGDFERVTGDFVEVVDGFALSLVEIEDNLLAAGGFAVGVAFEVLVARALFCFLRSSSTGGSPLPPLTASSSAGSAGFIVAGSSSAPVRCLSGFSAGLSTFCIFVSEPNVRFTSTKGVATGDAIAISSDSFSCPIAIVFLKSSSALPALPSLKLPLRTSVLVSRWRSAAAPPSMSVAMRD